MGTKRNIKFKPNSGMIHSKKVPPFSNKSKKCLLRLYVKIQIIYYPRPDKLLNERSELISKCRHANKFLLRNNKTKH